MLTPRGQRFIADHRRACGQRTGLLRGVDALILMLPTSEHRRGGAEDGKTAAALRAGTLVVDMSSSVPTRTRDLATRLTGPVFGSGRPRVRRSPRRDRGVAILAGGEQADLDQLGQVFAPLASTVIVVGPVGSGHAAKALNNWCRPRRSR